MATLCTEIGMPKYRQNKKKWKSFLPGITPANICHRQCLVCEGVSGCYTVGATSVYDCVLTSECEGIHIHVAVERVHLSTNPANVCLCDSIWVSAGVCNKYSRIYMYI